MTSNVPQSKQLCSMQARWLGRRALGDQLGVSNDLSIVIMGLEKRTVGSMGTSMTTEGALSSGREVGT